MLFWALLFSFNLRAEVQIKPYKNDYSWQKEWGQTLNEEMSDHRLTAIDLDKDDLLELGCPGYNEASFLEKKDFWITFFSSLTRAESAFNPKAVSAKRRGHRSYGLLQIAKDTARVRCDERDVFNPLSNLRCGVKLMIWQLEGAPVSETKKLRPDLEGQLFGKYIFQWGPLREQDRSGRKLLVDWFRDHLEQLPFCSQSKQ